MLCIPIWCSLMQDSSPYLCRMMNTSASCARTSSSTSSCGPSSRRRPPSWRLQRAPGRRYAHTRSAAASVPGALVGLGLSILHADELLMSVCPCGMPESCTLPSWSSALQEKELQAQLDETRTTFTKRVRELEAKLKVSGALHGLCRCVRRLLCINQVLWLCDSVFPPDSGVHSSSRALAHAHQAAAHWAGRMQCLLHFYGRRRRKCGSCSRSLSARQSR